MSLDRRDNEFSGDAYDPFNYQQRQPVENDTMQLKQAANYMNVQNTIGSKMWAPEQQQQQQQQQE